ncbi:hypothetical protein ACNAW0_24470 [Micromonospora sp. SL1-18]|uniref:hypothetical protein n=1 Tax=Micromonospora sp. SL1-18 TaxID=3399128 RepID=UPI003A4E2B3B
MSRVALRQVAQGPGRCLLSVEFPGDSSGPGLAAALAGQGEDYEIWRLDPVTTLDLQAELHDYAALARLCVAEFQRLRPGADPAVSVVGYCSAARFAHHVTGSLATARLTPRSLVLVAPRHPTEQTVRDEFDLLCRKLTGDSRTDPAFPLLDDATAAIGRLTTRLADQARDFANVAGYGPAEAAEAVDEIVGRYRAWLWFLLQAARPATPQIPCRTTEIVGDGGQPEADEAATVRSGSPAGVAGLVLRAV